MTIDRPALQHHLATHRYLYILVGLSTLLNIRVWYELVGDWMVDDNYSHGFLVVPVAIWVIYSRRKELHWPVKLSGLGVAIALAGSLGLILGIAAGEYFTTRFSLVVQLTGIGLAYLGTDNFRKVWFAFFFLLFMIPIPGVIYYQATIPMQLLASKATTFLLHLFGVPALRQGNIIHLPEYSLEVIEACSGMRSLVTLLALSSFYAWLNMTGKVRSVILTLATFPIAIAANVFRIFVTAIGAYVVSRELAESFLHEVSGLLVFISALIMIMITGAILKWTAKSSRS